MLKIVESNLLSMYIASIPTLVTITRGNLTIFIDSKHIVVVIQ